jgi:hypothetical protein
VRNLSTRHDLLLHSDTCFCSIIPGPRRWEGRLANAKPFVIIMWVLKARPVTKPGQSNWILGGDNLVRVPAGSNCATPSPQSDSSLPRRTNIAWLPNMCWREECLGDIHYVTESMNIRNVGYRTGLKRCAWFNLGLALLGLFPWYRCTRQTKSCTV